MARRRGLLAGFVVTALVAAVVLTLLRLEREDPITRCPAVVVLNGDQPARADAAAQIEIAGYATEVWLTNDPRSGTTTVPDAGTVSNARRLALRGVSPAAIRVLPGAAHGTRAELGLVRDEAHRRSAACVIIVTSPAHAARVRVLWRKLPQPKPVAIVRHASGPGYTGARVRARELALLIAAWIGWPG